MARNRKIAAASDMDGPRDSARRALITFGAPAAGAAGLAALLGRLRPTAGATADRQGEDDPDGAGLTDHREAYYRRARF